MEISIVDRVECPLCNQRTYREDDCICCGGINFVDTSNVMPVIEQTLKDLESGKTRASKQTWLAIGLYPLEDGTWYLVDTIRNVRKVSDEEVKEFLFVDTPFTLQSCWQDIKQMCSKVLSAVFGLIRKPIL